MTARSKMLASLLSVFLLTGGAGAASASRLSREAAAHGPAYPVHGSSTALKRAHNGSLRYGRGSRVAFGRSTRSGHSSGGGIQCVAFARADTGIELSGNANTWWDHAAGLYERGARPEPGSVLNFRANGSMRMGHVAVVSSVLSPRAVEIDHANWSGPGAGRGRVSRDITVVDVSPGNDWSAVRVGLGHSGEFGSIYPTYGFIYNRPDRGLMVANASSAAPVPALNPAPRDLRGIARGFEVSFDEVAEAPEAGSSAYRAPHHRHHTSHHRRH